MYVTPRSDCNQLASGIKGLHLSSSRRMGAVSIDTLDSWEAVKII